MPAAELILERDQPLTELSRCAETALQSGGRIALIGGEAGMGKTTLVQTFVAQGLPQRRVLWGACDSLFTPRPLAPLHDIARQVQGPLLDALNHGRSRDVIFDAALTELESTPTCAVFEDLHWADDATLDLFKFLGRRIQRTRSLLIATFRDDEVGPRHPFKLVIGDLPRAHVSRIALMGLSPQAVAQLANATPREIDDLHRITGGNPLFVTEVLAAADTSIPVTVRDAVLSRVGRLPGSAHELAELIAVIPNRAEARLLDVLAHPDEATIESCLTAGIVRYDDGALGFRHELTRRALEDALTQVRREKLHARVLEGLKAQGDAPLARLAHHADGARAAHDALHYAQAAAALASSVGAHRAAASHFQVALRYANGLSRAELAKLYEDLAYESYLIDQVEESIVARSEALAIWREAGDTLRIGDTLRWLSRLNWFAGRRLDAQRYGVEAVNILQSLPPGRELAMAYSNRAQLGMLAHDAPSAVEWGTRAIEIATHIDDQEILAHALNNLGTGRLVGGDEAGWEELQRSLDIALANRWQEHVARAYTNLSSMSVTKRRYDEAEKFLDEGIGYCERYDLDAWRLYMLAWSARAKFERGAWLAASLDVDMVLQHPRTSAVSRTPALIVLGHLRVRRGDPEAMNALDAARELVEKIDELQRTAPLAVALAEAAWLAGEHARVAALIAPVYELALRGHDEWLSGELAVWLARANATTESPDVVAAPHQLELAGEFVKAAEAWEALGCPYERALVLTRTADAEHLRVALQIFEELGAAPAAQYVRQQLRVLGVRGVPRGARASTRSNPHGLTKREAQIYELVCTGLRNAAIAKRLYLSTKTVDHHVSAILAKLGVPSRAEAIALARETAGNADVARS